MLTKLPIATFIYMMMLLDSRGVETILLFKDFVFEQRQRGSGRGDPETWEKVIGGRGRG